MLQLAQFSDIIKAYEMLVTAKSSGLDLWEGIMLALFILKDVAIVGGILGTIIWYNFILHHYSILPRVKFIYLYYKYSKKLHKLLKNEINYLNLLNY